MAKAKSQVPEFDRDAWEYMTYAPGQTCSACLRMVQPLEPVRRGTIDRTPGPPVIVYRHDECPTNQTVVA